MVLKKLLWSAVIFCGIMSAQEFRATISGRVTDAQSSVVAGAKVVVLQVDTNARFETTTNEAGLYTIPFLPPST